MRDYTLELAEKTRPLLFLLPAMFGIVGILVLVEAIRAGSILYLLFVAAWCFFAFRFMWRILTAPTFIEVFDKDKVRFTGTFGRSREMTLGDIDGIEITANIMTIRTKDRNFVGFYGFDGFSRFVHDVKRANPSATMKGC